MLITTKRCPKCGATVANDNKVIFCQYCGSRIAIKDSDNSYNVKIDKKIREEFFDETKAVESENAKQYRIKELEYLERQERRSVIKGILNFIKTKPRAFSPRF